MPDELIRWTGWLSMASLAAMAACRTCRPAGRALDEATARSFWTTGCLLLWTHVAFAFQFQHRWSHTEAYAHTAMKTRELTGFDWGGGLYFNYAMMLLWAGDTLWWWLAPESRRRRPAPVGNTISAFFVFMAVNATVVFGAGLLRWLAAATTLLLGFCALRRRARGASP
jgi:hypothetical protein